MNLDCFTELVTQYEYDEIKVIGKDMLLHGKQVHVIALLRQGEQAELCMLIRKQKKKRNHPRSGRRESNRELMRYYVPNDCMNMQKLCMDDYILESKGAQAGELSTYKLDSILLMAKLIGAGWSIPADHPLYKEEWEQIELACYQFYCPYEQLPEWEGAKVKICWHAGFKRYLIEKQIVLTIGDLKNGEQGQIAFSIQSENGTKKDGICYIDKVSLEEPWEEIDKREKEQICPRGTYFLAVEYECTLPLDLRFYMTDDLDAKPDCSQKTVNVMQAVTKGQELGTHGLPLKSALIQSAVTADVKEVRAELFEAYEMVPAWEEQVAIHGQCHLVKDFTDDSASDVGFLSDRICSARTGATLR